MINKTLLAKNISKSYGDKLVIRDISIEIKQGEVVGLLGPNGAGKTTTFYMIVGLVKADKGNIFLNQSDITNLAIHQRASLGIGYLPQEASIFRGMNVE
jgi:lipopolysaccharide export system ATP-binding protein